MYILHCILFSRDVVEVVDKDLVIFDPKEEEDFFFHHGKKLAYRDINKKMPKNLQFNFDQVFSPEESTGDVYYKSIQTLISSLMGGYNCSGSLFCLSISIVIIFSSSMQFLPTEPPVQEKPTPC